MDEAEVSKRSKGHSVRAFLASRLGQGYKNDKSGFVRQLCANAMLIEKQIFDEDLTRLFM